MKMRAAERPSSKYRRLFVLRFWFITLYTIIIRFEATWKFNDVSPFLFEVQKVIFCDNNGRKALKVWKFVLPRAMHNKGRFTRHKISGTARIKMACTKTRNNETKPPKRNHRNEQNNRNETTETSETSKTKRLKQIIVSVVSVVSLVSFRLFRSFCFVVCTTRCVSRILSYPGPRGFSWFSPHERAVRESRSSDHESQSGEKEKLLVTLDLNLTFMQTPGSGTDPRPRIGWYF